MGTRGECTVWSRVEGAPAWEDPGVGLGMEGFGGAWFFTRTDTEEAVKGVSRK